MKIALIYILCFVPLIGYNLVCFYTKNENSKIDQVQIVISGILAFAGHLIAQRIINQKKNR